MPRMLVPVSSISRKLTVAFAVVVDGDGGVPDFDALVAEKFGPGDEAGLPHQGQADELAGNALHAGGDVGDDRRVDEAVAQEKDPREIGHQPDAQQHVGEGGKDVDADGDPEIEIAPPGRRVKQIPEAAALGRAAFPEGARARARCRPRRWPGPGRCRSSCKNRSCWQRPCPPFPCPGASGEECRGCRGSGWPPR